jgi:hypothetical protein
MAIHGFFDPKKQAAMMERVKKGLPPPDFSDWKPAPETPAQDAAALPQITSTPVPNSNLVVLDQKLNYIEAWNAAKAQNKKLAPHALHDDYLVMSDHWKTIQNVYPAWCREWLVYPEKDGMFTSGKDIVDTHELNGEKWRVIFPASYIPQQALGIKGVCLFVDPSGIVVDSTGKELIVHTSLQSVIVLNNFLQENGWGQADANTRIPLSVPEDVLDTLLDNQKRYLWRVSGNGVRPLARVYVIDRFVYTGDDFSGVLGVCLIP